VFAQIVHQTLRRQLEALQILPVNATLGLWDQMEAHAPSATQVLIKLDSGLIVLAVPPIHCQKLAAFQRRPVNVTLGMREKMEAYVLSAVSTNTKQAWGLLIALIVHQTLSL